MRTPGENLSGADWFAAPAVRAIFAALKPAGEETRIVGGAVRNALMGVPVGDVDFATTATPETVAKYAEQAGLKVVPTGIEHGTLTLVAGGHGFEITTLRQDVATDGRRAVVRFGRDWVADAERRDFTVNALSADADGDVHDPLGGYADIVARRIRFIGDPDKRIAEDRLRILRLFRFHAEYGRGALDRAGYSAAIRGRAGIRELSAERIGQEMRRLVAAEGAADSLTLMQDGGILPVVLAGVAYLGPLRRLVQFEEATGAEPEVASRLTALAVRVSEDVVRLAERLRLANTIRDRMFATIDVARQLALPMSDKHARSLIYRFGPQLWRDGLAQAFAVSASNREEAIRLYNLPDGWAPPVFPLGGRDVVAAGGVRGPAVGEVIRALENWWIENDFGPDEAALRARLQEMVADGRKTF